MFNKLVERIGYGLSVLFLVVTIYSSTFGNSEFGIKSLIGTDSLTLYGSVMALITMFSLKFSKIRKLFKFILLKFNILDFDYKVKIQLLSLENVDVSKLHIECINLMQKENISTKLMWELKHKSPIQINSYVRTMAANFNVSTSINNNGYEYIYNLNIDGVSKFSRMDKNIKQIISMVEDLKKSEFLLKSISLTIDKTGSEADIATNGFIFSRKDVKVISSNIVIKNNEESDITINNKVGINLSSQELIKFTSSYEVVQELLIS